MTEILNFLSFDGKKERKKEERTQVIEVSKSWIWKLKNIKRYDLNVFFGHSFWGKNPQKKIDAALRFGKGLLELTVC